MAGFDKNLNYGTFDPHMDPTSVGSQDKARKRALFLHCAGPKVQDTFDTLKDTGEDFETAAEKLIKYFEPRKHHLFNIYQFRQLTQEKEESNDDFATRLKQAAGPCDFPTDWCDVEIQLQLIEKGKTTVA